MILLVRFLLGVSSSKLSGCKQVKPYQVICQRQPAGLCHSMHVIPFLPGCAKRDWRVFYENLTQSVGRYIFQGGRKSVEPSALPQLNSCVSDRTVTDRRDLIEPAGLLGKWAVGFCPGFADTLLGSMMGPGGENDGVQTRSGGEVARPGNKNGLGPKVKRARHPR